jgi:hypothetical protein
VPEHPPQSSDAILVHYEPVSTTKLNLSKSVPTKTDIVYKSSDSLAKSKESTYKLMDCLYIVLLIIDGGYF